MKPRATLPSLALLSVVLAGALVGCSGSSTDSGGSSGSGGSVSKAEAGRDGIAPVPASAPEAPTDDQAARSAAEDAYAAGGGKNRPAAEPDLVARAVIRKGDVALRADDVGKAQFDVRRIVGRFAGEVTDEKTSTDDDGKPAYTNLVLRIPTAKFSAAMADLQKIGELESANSSEQDVTTKLIDVQTRLKAQKRSIARITVLFDRAQSIRDIMAIEAQLSQRQADLDSLERQAAYLRGQTSMSTITVSIEQTPAKAVKKAEKDHTGFLAGLSAGWDALAAFAIALATALGALLPWLIVVAILGPPAYLVVRSVRRRLSARSSARTPSAA